MHPCAAAECHGADGEIDFPDGGVFDDPTGALCGGGEDVVRVAVEEEGGGLGNLGGTFCCANDPWGFAAFG